MSSESLSQNQVENLLKAMESADAEDKSESPADAGTDASSEAEATSESPQDRAGETVEATAGESESEPAASSSPASEAGPPADPAVADRPVPSATDSSATDPSATDPSATGSSATSAPATSPAAAPGADAASGTNTGSGAGTGAGAGEPSSAARSAGRAKAVGTAKPDKPYSPGVPPGARITAYDFKRPERVGKDQMRAMHSLHESIARNFGAAISGMLRTMIEVKLLSVDQLTYSEFVFSLDNPSCFNVIKPEPLDGHWILDISPALAYAVIDRMLGGDPVPGENIRRPLTEIETRLMCRVVDVFFKQIAPAWENIVDLQPVIDATESNPQLVQIVPPNEVVILIGFEAVLGKNRGMMNLCIPFNTIEKFNSKLSRNGWAGYGRVNPTRESRRKIVGSIDAAPVDVVVTLARSRIKTSDLLDLGVGDIITTEQEVSTPMELAIQDVPKFRATAGAYRGKKAVQIHSAIQSRRAEAPDSADDAESKTDDFDSADEQPAAEVAAEGQPEQQPGSGV